VHVHTYIHTYSSNLYTYKHRRTQDTVFAGASNAGKTSFKSFKTQASKLGRSRSFMKRSGDGDICTVMIANQRTNERTNEPFLSTPQLPAGSCAACIFPALAELATDDRNSLTDYYSAPSMKGKVRKEKTYPRVYVYGTAGASWGENKMSFQHGAVRRLRGFGHMIPGLRANQQKERNGELV